MLTTLPRCAVAFATALLALGTTFAEAAPVLQVDANGKLIGATGVNVNGSLYDVSFIDGTCAALFGGCDSVSDFTFQTDASATSAARALLDTVFLDGPSGQFNSVPTLIAGCEQGFVCNVITPWGLDSTKVYAAAARNFTPGIGDDWDTFFPLPSSDTGSDTSSVYALWAPRAVIPNPPTLALVALAGMAMVGIRHRRHPDRRQQS